MDVGFYLGELLMQRGEVRVPGLGYFSQMRMSAYYDESEALFYPPYNKVHFEQQADVESAELAEYLAAKKGISLASAKYFIDKYIANLREQAIVADVPLGNMGIFYTDRAELTFRPNDRLTDDSELYGYAPVKLFKVNAIPADPEPIDEPELIYPPRQKAEPEIAETIEEAAPEVIDEDDNTFTPTYDDGFLDLPEEEEEERRGPMRAILITLAVLSLLALGVFALYKYQPDTFNKLQFWKNNKPAATVKPTPKVIVAPKPDSLDTDSIKLALKDSAARADSISSKPYELISNKGYKTLPEAKQAVDKFRALGINDAKLFEEIPGPLIRVSLGSFSTLAESEALKQKLIEEKKITDKSFTFKRSEE